MFAQFRYQAFFVHFAKNSGRKKTQVLAIFGENQPIFCKTQVKFSQKSSDLLNKVLQKLRLKIQKLRFPAFHKLLLAEKVDKKRLAELRRYIKLSSQCKVSGFRSF